MAAKGKGDDEPTFDPNNPINQTEMSEQVTDKTSVEFTDAITSLDLADDILEALVIDAPHLPPANNNASLQAFLSFTSELGVTESTSASDTGDPSLNEVLEAIRQVRFLIEKLETTTSVAQGTATPNTDLLLAIATTYTKEHISIEAAASNVTNPEVLELLRMLLAMLQFRSDDEQFIPPSFSG